MCSTKIRRIVKKEGYFFFYCGSLFVCEVFTVQRYYLTLYVCLYASLRLSLSLEHRKYYIRLWLTACRIILAFESYVYATKEVDTSRFRSADITL